jgi:hypothetical protein
MRFNGSAKARRSAAEHHGKGDHARARNTRPAQRNIRRPPNNIAIKPTQKANSRNFRAGAVAALITANYNFWARPKPKNFSKNRPDVTTRNHQSEKRRDCMACPQK